MSKIGKKNFPSSWHNEHTNFENINPSDIGDVVGHHAQADRAQLDTAFDAARSAQKKWTTSAYEARQTILMSIGNDLRERRAELKTLLNGEEGKPLAKGVGNVFQAKQFFTYHAAGNPE